MSSHPPTHTHGGHEPHGKQSEDEIDYFKVIMVGVVSLVIFAGSTIWAAILLSQETARVVEATGASAYPAAGQEEIGIVDQVPFEMDNRLKRWRKEHDAKLNGYGWVDRNKGIAHVPIKKAMDAIAAGALPAGAPK
jgi:hypothetical protein